MISPKQRKVYIVEGKRSPFGKFGGALKKLTPVELSVKVTESLLQDLRIDREDFDQVLFANVIPSTPDTLYAGRHLALKTNMKTETPGVVINRLCGSGIQTIIDATRLIQLEEANLILVSGAESMSMAPHLVYGSRFGTKYGSLRTRDFLLDTLTDEHTKLPMGITAENLAEKYNISREDSDLFSFNSHQKANKAYENHLITPELVSIPLSEKRNFDRDEHLRSQISIEEMNQLKPSFKKEGTVTPGSASGIVDGACSLVIASEDYVKKHQLTPLAEIISGEIVGVDPAIMGIGPVPAIQKLLKKNQLDLGHIDFFEINEAFAPQVIACQKELGIPDEKVNIWGGAVALGHPLGATGLKITLTLARQLKHYKKELGISSACIGGGQGIALLIKRV